ncbi:hypothetical protein NQ317_016873 [Molorchus minor]|uniref:Chitin-binding type-2 domain-containing protein n=1 Tax=Molorchus minor TaxID=1323400 RepID=A0ABQ9J6T4_9CUCU|nr:hypothetical protein NQ317_016873 [Molorchus minor]
MGLYLFDLYLQFFAVKSQNDQKKAKADDKKNEEYECPHSTGNGNYADPATCKRFYQCVDGYPYVNRCPSGLYFDDISKFCTFKNEARCGPIATNSQMILLTFDGAVNLNNYDHYRKVFNHKRFNPNGCEIKGTFFISHEYSNYHMIQELASEGHEMATETISLQSGLEDKGYEEWVGEMVGMRDILKNLANISKSEVVGMRAPFLKPGRNTQYKVLEEFGYIYDSSIGVPALPIAVWPYTLDYKIPHECKSGTCPTKSFPEDVFKWLQEDFLRYYDQNRAPYMMPFHTNWFSIKELEQGLQKFLQWG